MSDLNKPAFRKATSDDIDAITNIYDLIHRQEADGLVSIGWDPAIYPTRRTAESALAEGSLFVMELDDVTVGAAIINKSQPEEYRWPEWIYPTEDDKVGVLHTLVIHPDYGHAGLGRKFVDFFEKISREAGCEVVRLDTQEQNIRPLHFYPKVGYRLAGIYDSTFQNLGRKIRLAMFEKKL